MGITNSKFLTPLKKGWIKLGEILGKFIDPIVMGFIYFFVITPIGILLRLFGKDLLNIKFNKKVLFLIMKKVIKNNITDKIKLKLKNDFVAFDIHL